MTIGSRTPGAWASGSTSVAPALPASIGAGDMMILFVGAKPFSATINQPTGWTRIGTQQTNGSTANGTDTGSVTWSVFYRAWQSGDAAPSVSITSGNVALACIHGKTKTEAAWITPTAYFGSDTSSGTGYSATAASSSGALTAGDALIHATVIAGNNSTFGTPTITATSATIGTVTESPATEGTTATGLDLEASSAVASVTAGTSTANAVCGWTLSVAQTGGSALVRLREDLTKTLTPSLFTSGTNEAFAATIVPGAVTLTTSLFTSGTNDVYAHTVATAGGAQSLTQDSRFDSATGDFYVATVSPGAITLTAGLFGNSNAFHAATVAPGAVSLTPVLVSNAEAFYSPTVVPGAVELVAGLFTNDPAFFGPSVGLHGSLLPPRIDNAQEFYVATVESDAYLITKAQARLLWQVYLLHGLKAGSPLTVSATARMAGGLEQAISEGGGTVTISTNVGLSTVGADPGLMCEELAALHGIGVDLAVTVTSRSAGAISQSFAVAGGVTTVARV